MMGRWAALVGNTCLSWMANTLLFCAITEYCSSQKAPHLVVPSHSKRVPLPASGHRHQLRRPLSQLETSSCAKEGPSCLVCWEHRTCRQLVLKASPLELAAVAHSASVHPASLSPVSFQNRMQASSSPIFSFHSRKLALLDSSGTRTGSACTTPPTSPLQARRAEMNMPCKVWKISLAVGLGISCWKISPPVLDANAQAARVPQLTSNAAGSDCPRECHMLPSGQLQHHPSHPRPVGFFEAAHDMALPWTARPQGPSRIPAALPRCCPCTCMCTGIGRKAVCMHEWRRAVARSGCTRKYSGTCSGRQQPALTSTRPRSHQP